jgi:hypothetical protein
MIDSLQALLIVVFVLVPGYLCDRTYRKIVGDRTADSAVQLMTWLAFSLVTGGIYGLIWAGVAQYPSLPSLPPLEYANLSALEAKEDAAPLIPMAWFLALLGHAAVAVACGLAAGGLGARFGLPGFGYRFRNTWDHVLSGFAKGRRVLIERTDGRVLTGWLRVAMRLKDPPDKDLFIEDPVPVSGPDLRAPDDIAYLFLPASEIRSIMFLANETDFTRRDTNAKREQQQRWWQRTAGAAAGRIREGYRGFWEPDGAGTDSAQHQPGPAARDADPVDQ